MSLKLVLFGSLGAVSYSPSIVTMALYCKVCEIIIIIIIIKTFITRKFAEAANARSVDSTEEKRLQSLFEDVQRDVR